MKTIETKSTESLDLSNHLETQGEALVRQLVSAVPDNAPDLRATLASSGAFLTGLAGLGRLLADAARAADAELALAVRDRVSVAKKADDAKAAAYEVCARTRTSLEGTHGAEVALRVAGKGQTPRRHSTLVAWAERFERRLRDDAAAWPTLPNTLPLDRAAAAAELAARIAELQTSRAALKALDGRIASLRVDRETKRRALVDARGGLATVTEGLLVLTGQRAAVRAVLPKRRKPATARDEAPNDPPVVPIVPPRPALPPAT